MEKVTIEGIILNETNYGETSKILNILTKEYGYISVISKGCRTMKSKLRGISMKLIYAKFTINYKPQVSILLEGNLINHFKNIVTNIENLNYSLNLINLIKKVLIQNNDKQIFSELKSALFKINDGFNASLITNIMQLKLLKYLGVNPNFHNCLICQSENIITYDLKQGGALCSNCAKNTYLFQPSTIKLLKLFIETDLDKITKLNLTKPIIIEEIKNFIKEYYEIYTGILLKI